MVQSIFIALLAVLLAGCAGIDGARRATMPAVAGLPASVIYGAALRYYASRPILQYSAGLDSGVVDIVVLDTVIAGDPRFGARDSGVAWSCPACLVPDHRDMSLVALSIGRHSLLHAVLLPIDSVSDPSKYFVGMRVYRADEVSEYLGDLAEEDSRPARIGLALDRSGAVVATYGDCCCTFDVSLGPARMDIYRNVVEHLARKQEIRQEFEGLPDPIPLRVLPVVSRPTVDAGIIDDVEGLREWRDTASPPSSVPELAEIPSVRPCGTVRDSMLQSLSTSRGGERRLLVELSTISRATLPGYLVVEARLCEVSATEPDSPVAFEFGGPSVWYELMILDGDLRVVFSAGGRIEY